MKHYWAGSGLGAALVLLRPGEVAGQRCTGEHEEWDPPAKGEATSATSVSLEELVLDRIQVWPQK